MVNANDPSIINNSLLVYIPNISVSSAVTTPPTNINNASVNSGVLSQTPLLLKSLNLTYDTTFATKYSIMVKLNGLNIANNQFNLVPAASGGFDFVPVGNSYLIPAGSVLEIYAYNSGGASSNGTLNVLAVFDILPS